MTRQCAALKELHANLCNNKATLLKELKECANSKHLQRGKQLHLHALESGYYSDVTVANTLISMYAKCECLVEADNVFNKLPCHTVVSYNNMILGYAANGEELCALNLFARTPEQDSRTYVAALTACSSLATKTSNRMSLELGMQIHSHAARIGFDTDVYLSNALIDMYAKGGALAHSWSVFNILSSPDLVSWNTLIMGCINNGDMQLALDSFTRMQHQGFAPNHRTFVAVLTAMPCKGGDHARVEQVKHLHFRAITSGYFDLFVANTLVEAYSKCGSFSDSKAVFELMPSHNVVSITSMMLACVENGYNGLALKIFNTCCVPNPRTFLAALMACVRLATEEEGEEIITGRIVKLQCLEKGMGLHSQALLLSCVDTFVANTLIEMYVECGSMLDARRLFDRMPSHDVVSWNNMILGYAERDTESELALELFSYMTCTPDSTSYVGALLACCVLAGRGEKEGLLRKGMHLHSQSGATADVYLGNSLVDMYAKCGSMVSARMVFDRMPSHNVVSWTSLIQGCVENGEDRLALELFQCIGCEPNARTFLAALSACCNLAELNTGLAVHAEVCRKGLENDVFIGNALVDLYGKCGSMLNAEIVFGSMYNRSSITWSSLVAGYSRDGNTGRLFKSFQNMCEQGLQVNGATFLCVLSVCSHCGLVERGRYYFNLMTEKYRLEPGVEHYHCLIDTLGRANLLYDAVEVVNKMGKRANVITWKIVLSACRKWSHVEVGKEMFEKVVGLNDKEDGAYLLMANIYASVGMYVEQSKVLQRRMRALAWQCVT